MPVPYRRRVRRALVLALCLAGCGARTGLALDEPRGSDAGAPRVAHRTLSMSWSQACAIVDGGVSCWGDNSLDVVAEGAPLLAPPTRVPGLSAVVEVATGQLVSCALTDDGSVFCSSGPSRTLTGGSRTSSSSCSARRIRKYGASVARVRSRVFANLTVALATLE